MIDADVQRAIKSVLDTGLATAGFTVLVTQSFQPTRQGAPLIPAVVFTKIATRRFGFQGQQYVLVTGNPDTFQKTEVQYLRPTYQLSGLMNQNPVDSNSFTAYDVLDACAMILQSAEGRAAFKLVGIGIDRVTDIREPHSLDDSDRFTADVSFDFTLSYRNELASIIPSAGVEGTIDRV